MSEPGKPTMPPLYYAIMDEITRLMKADPKPDTPEGVLLLLLASAAETYERQMFPEMFFDAAGRAPAALDDA